MTESAFISIGEAARMAGVPRWTIRRRCNRIGVHLVKSPHDRRLLLIPARDIEAVLNVDAALARQEVAA